MVRAEAGWQRKRTRAVGPDYASAVEIIEDVTRVTDKVRTVPQQRVCATAVPGTRMTGNRADRSPEIGGYLGGDQRSGALCCLDDDGHLCKRSDDPVSRRERPAVRDCAWRKFRHHRRALRQLRVELLPSRGVGPFGAAGEDCNRLRASSECAFMSGGPFR